MLGRATATFTGRRRCSTRPACCARSSNGTTSCATASSSTTVVDRALAIAATEPRGPVYLSLPREVIAAPLADAGRTRRRRGSPGRAGGAGCRRRSRQAAQLLAQAKRPADRHRRTPAATRRHSVLGAVRRALRDPGRPASPALSVAAVVHPMNLGYNPARFVAEGDAILVIECDVPWMPSRGRAQGRLQGHPYRPRSACSAAIRSAVFPAMSPSPEAPSRPLPR